MGRLGTPSPARREGGLRDTLPAGLTTVVVIVSRLGDPLPVRAFVWVDSWQQQCCGEEFRVGSEIHWHGHRTKERKSWITTLLGAEWADAVEYEENHHGPPDALNPLVELHGMVRSIRVVTCDGKTKPNSTGFSRIPVPGSGRLQMVEVADPWKPEPPAQAREMFAGWIVELVLRG